ncbi:MAG: hypothetical protein J5884_00735 [Paludibacteraceae bacterium]|nr:hypothetical protein [Paludibacteraceae bacterium]
MEYTFDDWKKALQAFQSSVEKDLAEIRQHKAEVLQIKADIENEYNRGRYFRDERRIVLSAPEVIIGNVDKTGCLLSGGGTIVIRSNNIAVDGAGEGGSVTTRAASIRQIAVDPGADGNEAVVEATSEVVTQARNISIQSNDAKDVFAIPPVGSLPGGVRIHADGVVEIDGSQSVEWKKSMIDEQIKKLEKLKSDVKSAAGDRKQTVDQLFGDLKDLMDKTEKLRGDDDDVRTNVADINDLNEQIQALSPSVYNAVDSYINSVSILAEASRQLKALKAQKDALAKPDQFKEKTTGAGISMRGEYINIVSADGDGNLRDNEGAGLSVTANKMSFSAVEHDGQLKEKGALQINAKTIDVSTTNTKMKDEKSGEVTSEGDITVTSKTLTVQALDSEIKDNKPEEKALTKDSKISFRAEKMDFNATDTEGKATGSIDINAKAVSVKSMDVDKDKRTDKELAKGSTTLLLAEKMYIGAKDDKNKSKSMQAVSEEIGLFADKTLEAQQDKGKAVVQLSGGNVAVGGSKTEIYGATTIQAKTEIKDELKAPKATIDHVEAKSSFKSSNISDGIPIPAPPASAKLSAKLKSEELKDKS